MVKIKQGRDPQKGEKGDLRQKERENREIK